MLQPMAFATLTAVLLSASVCSAADGPTAQAFDIADAVTATRLADLKEQLELGLRARRPSEFAFIARVVTKVEAGELSLEMVIGVFHWARKRSSSRPFPHFEFGLRERAKKVGVNL